MIIMHVLRVGFVYFFNVGDLTVFDPPRTKSFTKKRIEKKKEKETEEKIRYKKKDFYLP